jgi:hypothetical protein
MILQRKLDLAQERVLFRDPETLHRREIDVPHAGTDQVISSNALSNYSI